MLLSEATESQLLEALRALMPKTLYGHEVTMVTVSLHPTQPTQNIGFHLTTKSGHPVCGSSLRTPDSSAAAKDALFCVFDKGARTEHGPVILASGGEQLLQEDRFQ
jgi:hypothetical protein